MTIHFNIQEATMLLKDAFNIFGISDSDQWTGDTPFGEGWSKTNECKFYLFFGWMSLRYI